MDRIREPTLPSYAVYPSLRGRVVVVTGGASGIGEAIVEVFVRQGAQVTFLDVQIKAARDLVERFAAEGFEEPTFYLCDLADIAALRGAVARILERFGGVDVLVNNAGNDTRQAIDQMTSDSWDRTMALNLKHQFFMCQAVLPAMKAEGAGSIVNMSSIAWVIPSTGLPVYVAAKAAIVGMTRTLAHEVGAHGIRVNCVLPGAIATERQRQLWLTP